MSECLEIRRWAKNKITGLHVQPRNKLLNLRPALMCLLIQMKITMRCHCCIHSGGRGGADGGDPSVNPETLKQLDWETLELRRRKARLV